jgi:hypothetical protein
VGGTRLKVIARFALGAAVLAAAWFYTGPRYAAQATFIERTAAQCENYLETTLGYGSQAAAEMCLQAKGMTWFRVTARNVGFRGAYLKSCRIDGRDSSNRTVYTTELTVGLMGFVPGPHLNGGQSVTWEWFTEFSPPPGVRRYDAHCRPEEYPGGVPI